MPSNNPGPPPVERSAVATTEERLSPAVRNYQTIVETMKANNGAEARALRAMFSGDRKLVDRFLAVCFSLLAADNDLLARATPMSIIEAIKKAASLGLEPMTDDAAIVRYGDKAQLLPMYKGYLKRIRNSGKMKAVDVGTVYTEDEFDYGTNNQGFWFVHHPARARKDKESGENITSRGEYMGFYAFAVDHTGYTYGRYMDTDQINHIRDTFGKTHTSSGKPLPWVTSYEQMALKTVLRLLAKILPQEAVGQEFMLLEKQNDDAIAEISHKVDEAMVEIRDLALLKSGTNGSEPSADEPSGAPDDAAGQGGAPAATDAPADPDGAPAEPTDAPSPVIDPQEQVVPDRGPEPTADPGADPNVAAAMALSDEQEQLRRYRNRQR